MKSHIKAGQFNLKGKKSKGLRCQCCEVQNFRWREQWKRAHKEVREELLTK